MYSNLLIEVKSVQPKQTIIHLPVYQPGKPIEAVKRELGLSEVIKLASNENPFGCSPKAKEAIVAELETASLYPDGGAVELTAALAEHFGVQPNQIIFGAGSDDVILMIARAYLVQGDETVMATHTFPQYKHNCEIEGAVCIEVPLQDGKHDLPAMLAKISDKTKIVWVCNPNNPTGRVVSKQEIKQLLDGLPEDMPVLIDEAYHHFVEDPSYATSIPYVLEGRPVIIARTFSKIAALAGMRLGYAIAPRELVQQMRPFSTGTISAIVKYGGVAALRDTESQAQVKRLTIDLRTKTTKELTGMGYSVIPSDANFFMVHLRRPVVPVIEEFSKKGVLVGRPFPPMTEHLRVSIGTANEMDRFMVAFKEIMASPAKTASSGAR